MQALGRLVVFFILGLMAAGDGVVAAAERYRCDTEAIRDCGSSGCEPVAEGGDIAFNLPARTYRKCLASDCRDGAFEMWSGQLKPEDKGYVGFSQLGVAKGFTGSIDFDRGEFVLIEGSRFWHGRCKAE